MSPFDPFERLQSIDLDDAGATAAELAGKARDLAYTAVGLGVLSFQRAQVRRQEMARRAAEAEEQIARLRRVVAAGAQQVDEWLETTVQLVETSLQPLEEQLPPPARDLAELAVGGVRQLRTQLRQFTSPGA